MVKHLMYSMNLKLADVHLLAGRDRRVVLVASTQTFGCRRAEQSCRGKSTDESPNETDLK